MAGDKGDATRGAVTELGRDCLSGGADVEPAVDAWRRLLMQSC